MHLQRVTETDEIRFLLLHTLRWHVLQSLAGVLFGLGITAACSVRLPSPFYPHRVTMLTLPKHHATVLLKLCYFASLISGESVGDDAALQHSAYPIHVLRKAQRFSSLRCTE